jgi:hypothetical protein
MREELITSQRSGQDFLHRAHHDSGWRNGTKTLRTPPECGHFLEEAMQTAQRSSLHPKSVIRPVAHSALLVLLLSGPALCQPNLPPVAQTANLSGPRFGVTLLSDGVVKTLEERGLAVGPHISQFGWQFEKQFYTMGSGVTMVSEWVALLGGLEQNIALPSLSWMVGMRTRDGAEFGIGPNVTPAGTAFVLAAGMTFRAGVMNIPVNVAVVPAKSGTRITLLSGFSLRR